MPLTQLTLRQLRANPMHKVLRQLGRAASERGVIERTEFRRIVAYLLEVADGRDRREPTTQVQGIARPVPRLKILLQECFGEYAELEWFNLTKVTNGSGSELRGMFRCVAANISRVEPATLAQLVRALTADDCTRAVSALVHGAGGRIKGMGLDLFARLAIAFRPNLHFLIPRQWGNESGCLSFIDGDLRKYLAVCSAMRDVCNDLGIDEEVRGPILDHVLSETPPHRKVTAALNASIGPTLARFAVLEPADAFESNGENDTFTAEPLQFAARAIRSRRGDRRLRAELLRGYGNRCALTGEAPIDLLEVAYIVPFPGGHLHSSDNALLLRADLHTLWDLNLIAIDPATKTARISPRLKGSQYEAIEGTRLARRENGSSVSRKALEQRWSAFHGDTGERRRAGTSGPREREDAKHRPQSSAASPARPGTESVRDAEDRLSSSGSFHGIRVTP